MAMQRAMGAMVAVALLLTIVVPTGAQATTDGDTTVRPLSSACDDAPDSGFADRSRAGVHAAALDCVAWWNVTNGFPDGTFRPDGTVTRGQMASFITSTILSAGGQLPAPGTAFPDTDANVHRRPIERLATAGIVSGFPDGTYRPGDPVNRGQMATFLIGALDHLEVTPPDLVGGGGQDGFSDTGGTTHAERIQRAAEAGIAGGLPDGTYRPSEPVSRAQMATFLARLLATVTDTGIEPRAARAAVDRAEFQEVICRPGDADVERAERFMEGRYTFAPHPEVVLGTDLTWAEDPLGDNNWRFQFHTMRWLWPLIGATDQTGDLRYLDHAYAMARSWIEANPFDAPASDYSWNDHSAAWRSRVFGCLTMQGPVPSWLLDSIVKHRDLMADPSFYVQRGNHALNQDSGMLALACLTDHWDRRDLAAERIARLAVESVDEQGVTNEQAVEYQDYNYGRYNDALRLIEACGMPSPGWAQRIEQMPVVLTHMTQPDDTYVPIGDTDRRRAKFRIDHPNLRWMSTGGDSGEPPDETFVTYDAGFTFVRSGWGTTRPRLEENFLSVRHGEPRQLHGHLDHGSITLFSQGQPLLTDPGKYSYNGEPERTHVVSQRAHSLVTIGDDCPPPRDQPSEVTNQGSNEHVDHLAVRVATCSGTGWTRTIGFLRDTGEVVIVDEVTSNVQREMIQRWQLEPGANVEVVRPDLVMASWPSDATLMVEQLVPVASTTSVAGGRDPLRGWVSERYGELTAAANLEVTAPPGTDATLVTVLRPGVSGGSPASTLERTADHTTVTLATSTGTERTVTLPRARP